MLEIHNLKFTGLGDNTDQIVDDGQTVAIRKLGFKTEWNMDIDMLDLQKNELQSVCGVDVESSDEVTSGIADSTKATAIFIKRALISLTLDTAQYLPHHLKLYFEWMRDKHDRAKTGKLDYQNNAAENWLEMSREEEEDFLSKYVKKYPDTAPFICAVGQNLSGILDGSIDPLSIMLEDNMLDRIYAYGLALKSGLKMFQQWFDLKGHKQPDMKILEIGAGTGSITLPILEVLGGTGGKTPRFGSYCFSDISTSRIEKAGEAFRDWQGRLEFKKLDIEKSPESQGFVLGSFDVIAAGNVSSAFCITIGV